MPIPPKPPKGSAGEILWDKLNLVCYPWENFSVERSDFGGWEILLHSVLRWVVHQKRMMITDEMLQLTKVPYDDFIYRLVTEFRMQHSVSILTKYEDLAKKVG